MPSIAEIQSSNNQHTTGSAKSRPNGAKRRTTDLLRYPHTDTGNAERLVASVSCPLGDLLNE
jgi:hypothetical protein